MKAALAEHRPDLIECQDAYNLPWAALAHRRRFPDVALVAAYMTDFPTVYMARPLSRFLTGPVGRTIGRFGYTYAGMLYRRFDAVYAVSESGGASKLRDYGIANVKVVPLGVEVGEFGPNRRDPQLRHRLGLSDDQPLLVYAGRLDNEKKPELVADAFQRLPAELGAKLALIGEGPLRKNIAARKDMRIIMPGYVRDRAALARWLASGDIYVSGMADETFGISIIEAQASGLPVVGVAAGAMIDRVTEATGRLGPVDDAGAMAANILDVWNGDRSAMGRNACEHALQFSWERSMETLFGTVYPAAFARRDERLRGDAPKIAVAGASID